MAERLDGVQTKQACLCPFDSLDLALPYRILCAHKRMFVVGPGVVAKMTCGAGGDE